MITSTSSPPEECVTREGIGVANSEPRNFFLVAQLKHSGDSDGDKPLKGGFVAVACRHWNLPGYAARGEKLATVGDMSPWLVAALVGVTKPSVIEIAPESFRFLNAREKASSADFGFL
jgi:hypothetical protein